MGKVVVRDIEKLEEEALRPIVRNRILAVGFRTTVELLVNAGYTEESAIRFVREVHDSI